MPPIIVTGAAGFVGFHLARRLLDDGRDVVGVDSLNEYYDPTLKAARLQILEQRKGFRFVKLDLADREGTRSLFADVGADGVAHLAAQAGVRYSMENPHAYADSNLVAFLNVLEGCRMNGTLHLVYASTSSVYGSNVDMPFSEHQGVDHPISLYAATKRANELMAHSYSHLYGLPTTGLRFFTVYGPWGRPDMMMFIFTKAILAGRPIQIFNHGESKRDFTYIDDIVEAFVRVLARPPAPAPDATDRLTDPASGTAPFRIFNIGQQTPVPVMHVIELLERSLGRTAIKEYLPPQPGDVSMTWADVGELERATGFRPQVGTEEGVQKFVEWYRSYYRL
jgi:UDP-glucuronate 4-epimerase